MTNEAEPITIEGQEFLDRDVFVESLYYDAIEKIKQIPEAHIVKNGEEEDNRWVSEGDPLSANTLITAEFEEGALVMVNGNIIAGLFLGTARTIHSTIRIIRFGPSIGKMSDIRGASFNRVVMSPSGNMPRLEGSGSGELEQVVMSPEGKEACFDMIGRVIGQKFL